MAARSVDSEMESRVIEPRKRRTYPKAFAVKRAGAISEGRYARTEDRGRGRRAGQTITGETMKHGRPVPHQRTHPGTGRDRETTPTAPTCQLATDGTNGNKTNTSGPRGEIDSSQSGWKGSLSACVVPLESRRTEKRRDPGSREGRRPRTGTDAGRHELPH